MLGRHQSNSAKKRTGDSHRGWNWNIDGETGKRVWVRKGGENVS
jgi:hypothetical protein